MGSTTQGVSSMSFLFRRLSFHLFLSLLLLGVPMLVVAQAGSVILNWDYIQALPPSAPATQFQVYRQDGCAGAFLKLPTALLPVTTLMFTDATVTGGQTYCWYVTAMAATGKES